MAGSAASLGALLDRQKAIVLGEKKAMEQLRRAKTARAKYESSVAEALLRSLFDLGLGVEDVPFVIGAVLEAKDRKQDDYYVDLGTDYMTRQKASGAAQAAAEKSV